MRVGFIGLGTMGKPMSKSPLKAGYELVVFDFSKDVMKEVTECGAVSAANSREVVEQCGAVITVVPNSPHVRAAVLGESGVADSARPEAVLIDMSPIDPTESKAIGIELARRDIGMLDTPVSGGEPKTIGGTLSVIVSGKKEPFDKYYDMLMVVADSMIYVGELGSDSVAKLANQIVVTMNIAAVSEALIFVKKARTDPELVYQAIRGRLAGSTVMDARISMMLNRSFKPGLRIEPHVKDLNNVLNVVHVINSPILSTRQFTKIMQGSKADSHEKEDHAGIIEYYEKTANTTVES